MNTDRRPQNVFALRDVLYCAAWRCMGHLAEGLGIPPDRCFQNHRDVRREINALFWVGPEEPRDRDWLDRNGGSGSTP